MNDIRLRPRNISLIVLALIVLSGFTGPDEATADDYALEYRVTIGEQLNRMVVELCFTETNMPAALVAPDALSKSIDDISAILADGSTTKLRIRNRTIELAHAGLRCVGYTVRVAAEDGGGSRMGHNAHNGAVTVTIGPDLIAPEYTKTLVPHPDQLQRTAGNPRLGSGFDDVYRW